jgi:hypothetical protein
MTAIALPHTRRSLAPKPARRRFGSAVRGDDNVAVPDVPQTQIEEIRARLASGAYTVDAAKVADVIVERLLASWSGREAETGR